MLCVFYQSSLVQSDLAVIDDRDHTADDPAGRIAHSNWNNFVADSGHTEQIYLSEQNKGAEHDKHTGFAVACTTERTGVYLIEATQNIERRKHSKK